MRFALWIAHWDIYRWPVAFRLMPAQNASRQVPWHHCPTYWEITHAATWLTSDSFVC